MPNHDTTILTPSDRTILQLFDELDPQFEGSIQVQVAGLSGSLTRDSGLLNDILDADGSAITSITLKNGGLSAQYIARHQVNSNNLIAHAFYSVIRLTINDNNRPDDDFIVKTHTIVQRFLVENSLLPARQALSNQDDLRPNVALLSAIQSSASDQIARVNQFFADLTEQFDTRNQDLEAKYNGRIEKLEEQFAAKDKALQSEREALEARQKELDDRDNTHARRAIRGELIQTIQLRQKSFTISPETQQLRWPIHVVFVLLLIGTSIGAVWSLYVWGTNPNDAWGSVTVTSALKTAVFTFGFLTSAGLYISWMNRWFDKHADAQFQTKQFEIDINRATWAVEAALEWKNIQGEQMPDALLTGITKHLFEQALGEVPEYSPLEALASSILGSASSLKMNLNGNELSLDRKSIKQIKAAGDGR